MVSGTTYTSSRRYARKTGNPKTNLKGKPRAVRRNRRKKAKKNVAFSLSRSLMKKLDNRYVEEEEAETKLSPIFNTTDWTQLNQFGGGTGGGPSSNYPNVMNGNAPIAPASITDPTSGQYGYAVTGNVFQFGRSLSADLVQYNSLYTAANPNAQSPCFPIWGMDWYNQLAATTVPLPIGTNPTRVMDGQYLNLRRSTVNFSVNMRTVNPTEGRSFNLPCQFRVMHVTAKRDNSPAGVVYSPTQNLWLDELGQAKGLLDVFDQSTGTLGRVSKQKAMKYPINRQYFRVHTDFGFTLQNPLLPDGFDSGPLASSNTTFANGNYTYPAEKQFTITRNWGKQNKTIMVADDSGLAENAGLYIPQDENFKDYIIIIAVRGLCTPSSAGGNINTPDFGRAQGYTVSFFGTTSAKDF